MGKAWRFSDPSQLKKLTLMELMNCAGHRDPFTGLSQCRAEVHQPGSPSENDGLAKSIGSVARALILFDGASSRVAWP